ncbi:MAG: peroxidase family protein [Hyphomicrobiaceae bacterium]
MHGSNPLGVNLPEDPLEHPLTIRWGSQDCINFIRAPNPEEGEAFLAAGLIPTSGKLDPSRRKAVYHLMAALENRMWQVPDSEQHIQILGAQVVANPALGGLWEDPLESRNEEPPAMTGWENPLLPSGYTYLLQLVAHDMADTVRSAAIAEEGFYPEFRNVRQRALMLDTLYGFGPEESTHAYGLHGHRQHVPRSTLRTGDLRRLTPTPESPEGEPAPPPEPRRYCPFQDIARFAGNDQQGGRSSLTEALIADPRNDAHALMSQMTVLFIKLHNAIEGLLPDLGLDPTPETAYRRFLCARFVVTLIYRHIVANDLLPRILDPVVHAAYRDNPKLQLHKGPIASEFFAGAFRFGHAMVRAGYTTNSVFADQDLAQALNQSTHKNYAALPVSRHWAVDWDFFFGNRDKVNLSRRIGPFYSHGFMTMGPKALAAETGIDVRGLPARDFLTSTYTGLWSVPALFKEIKSKLDELQLAHLDLLPDFNVWSDALEKWFGSEAGMSPAGAEVVPRLPMLRHDPPLVFFVLFEAAHDFDRAGRPLPAVPHRNKMLFPGQGGRRLGRFGSILIADAFYSALRNQPFGPEAGRSMKERIEHVCGSLLGQSAKSALNRATLTQDGAAERKLDTMSELLALMAELRAFR